MKFKDIYVIVPAFNEQNVIKDIINNLLKKFSNVIDLKMITNWSIFYFLDGLKTFKSEPGQIVSIITKNRNVKITTVGLKYNLKDETLKFPSQGISNISLGSSFLEPSFANRLAFFSASFFSLLACFSISFALFVDL